MKLIVLTLWAALAHGESIDRMSCKDETDAVHLDEAVLKADLLVGSCLEGRTGGNPLNPILAALIRDVRKKPLSSFHCSYTLKGALASTRREGDGAKVNLNPDSTRPDEETSVPYPRPIDLTVFHEIVHAGDAHNRLVLSSSYDKRQEKFNPFLHNNAFGIPDGIYGCEFACAGELPPASERALALGNLLLLEQFTGAELEEDDDYVCPDPWSPECSPLKKYAFQCRWRWRLTLSEKERRGVQNFEAAVCLDIAHRAPNGPNYPPATPQEFFERINAIARFAADNDGGSRVQRNTLKLRGLGNYAEELRSQPKGREWRGEWLRELQELNSCPILPK